MSEMRKSLVGVLPAQKKASRRWIWDLCMMVVGALIGVYAGSAPVRAYAARAAHGHFRATSAAAVAATPTETTVAIPEVQRPLTPDLNRTASGAVQASPSTNVDVASAAKLAASQSKGVKRGRRPAGRTGN